ncbi:MAG: hypothetical protein ACJ747_13660 [Gaiellaceae bacterium]|nr:hypothetical protein [Acidobacteriota bacterium]
MRAPDYADALTGWRVWCVVDTPSGLRLASVIHDHVWEVGAPAVAACRERHSAPHETCLCGIHAARDPAPALPYLRGRNDPGTVARVLGRVLLWGTVIEHEQGWRASHARPLELWLPRALDGLGARYDAAECAAVAA